MSHHSQNEGWSNFSKSSCINVPSAYPFVIPPSEVCSEDTIELKRHREAIQLESVIHHMTNTSTFSRYNGAWNVLPLNVAASVTFELDSDRRWKYCFWHPVDHVCYKNAGTASIGAWVFEWVVQSYLTLLTYSAVAMQPYWAEQGLSYAVCPPRSRDQWGILSRANLNQLTSAVWAYTHCTKCDNC